MDLRTADGEVLHAVHHPGRTMDVGVVLAHGFTNHTRVRHVQAIRLGLSEQGVGVLAYDARGHGRSSGHSTVGDVEPLDLDAAVAAARRLGYRRVVTCGWSMGGSVAIRHAALRGKTVKGHVVSHPPDAVVSVSALSRWYYRDTAAMRRVLFAIEKRSGRAVARLVLRTRIWHKRWDPEPLSPVQCVGDIAPIQLLIVHGDADHYFPLEHPPALADAAGPSAQLWIEPGMGHAEKSATPDLIARLASYARQQVLA
ncbi:MAG: alpha/beta hydrolase [Kineosporiaceae bacterium]